MRLLVFTQTPFWRHFAGTFARDLALLRWLSGRAEITVFVLRAPLQDDRETMGALDFPVRFVRPPGAGQLDAAGYRRAVRSFLSTHHFDAYLVDRIDCAYVRPALPPGAPVYLDTHDLASVRDAASFERGHRTTPAIGWERELEIFERFDGVMMIQWEDHRRVAEHLGDRSLLVPHPVELHRNPLPDKVNTIGVIGSRWTANVDGLKWFLDRVWPRLQRTTELRLSICGTLGEIIDHPGVDRDPRIERVGRVPALQDLYRRFDLAINPVHWGSGLKIKTVEALGAGVPLVTTTEGARGLARLAGQAFLVADEPDRFADHIEALVRSSALRQRVADAGATWVRENLSPQACFGPFWARVAETVRQRSQSLVR